MGLAEKHRIILLTSHGESSFSFQVGMTLRDILIANGFAVRSACGGNAVCALCQVYVRESPAIPCSAGERLHLSAAQLGAGVRLSCQIIPETDLYVSIVQPVARTVWRPLRDDEYGKIQICKLRETEMRYGVAVDLGTTHIRLTLWDLFTGERIAGCAGLNPQSSYGADVLTRLMEASRSKEIADVMAGLVRHAIAEALVSVAAQASIKLRDVGEVCVVGNTAMMALLAGKNFAQLLQPENWTRRVDCQPDEVSDLCHTWGVDNHANMRFITSLGGFIGSDLLAGVIATRLIEQPAGSLLIDFGTNSEMALWDGHTLHVTSTAGGPAFEGCGISCGMPGETGAIYRLEQVAAGFAIHVLGGVQAQGLCGSGLVDAVAWLRRNARLDAVGRFVDSDGLVLQDGTDPIVLKRSDIDVLQRAKAAIGGGVHWLCQQARMSPGELQQVFACGAFGRLLDVANAQLIGLLPPVPEVRLEGNVALAGCEALLLSAKAADELAAILKVCKVYNLAEDGAFDLLFVENLYLQAMRG